MSKSPENVKASMPDPAVAEDEDDAWDKRIRKTGCFAENEQLLVCHADTNDWRQCARELAAFKKCMELNKQNVSELWREAALTSMC
ncbi:Cytochrome oxidase assembly factor 4 [Coemansia sp. S2]|nr:Cytochrome oxidase assembly factor 4 [Coemansia sp. S2]